MRLLYIIVPLIVLSLTGCKNRTRFELLATAVAFAAEEWVEQKEDTQNSFQKAEAKRIEAFAKGELKFKEKSTKKLIAQWEAAEKEVAALEFRLDKTIKEGDQLFAYAESRRDAIRDGDLRGKVGAAIENSKVIYAKNCIDAYNDVKQLRSATRLAKDTFIALEIAGALNALDERLVAFSEVSKEAVALSRAIRSLQMAADSALELELNNPGL